MRSDADAGKGAALLAAMSGESESVYAAGCRNKILAQLSSALADTDTKAGLLAAQAAIHAAGSKFDRK